MMESSGLKQQKKCDRLTERSNPHFIFFNLLLYSIPGLLVCPLEGMDVKWHNKAVNLVHVALSECKVLREKKQSSWPLLFQFGHTFMSESRVCNKLLILHGGGVSEAKYNTAGMRRHTLGENVITMWVHHLHQEWGNSSSLEGSEHTHLLPHGYISVCHLGILRRACLRIPNPSTVRLLWHLLKAKQIPLMSAFSIHIKKKKRFKTIAGVIGV